MQEQRPRRLRFSLRSLLVLTFVVAVITANWQNVFGFVLYCLVVSGPALFLASFFLARRLSCSASRPPSLPAVSLGGWIAVLIAIVPLALSVFVRRRWVVGWNDPNWPRQFPYPDLLLVEIHDWWDRLHPAGPYLKIHGEYYAVLMGVNVMAMIACALTGTVCGYVFRNASLSAAVVRCIIPVRKVTGRLRLSRHNRG